MIDGSTVEIAESLAHWATQGEGKMALIGYRGELSRISAVERLRDRLARRSIPLQLIELPVHQSPEDLVDFLVASLRQFLNGVVCVTGFGGAFKSKLDAARMIGLLNYRREEFGSLASWQVWWVPNEWLGAFDSKAVGTVNWFSLRLSMEETLGADNIVEVESQLGSNRDPKVAAAHRISIRCVKMLEWSLRLRLSLGLAVDFSAWAAGAPMVVGDIHDAGTVLQACLTATAKSAGWSRRSLELLVEDLVRDQRLSAGMRNARRLFRLGRVLQSVGEMAGSRLVFEKSLEIRERIRGPEHPDTSACISCLAMIYRSQGNLDRAVELYRQALRIDEKTKGPNHPDTATNLDNLGLILKDRRQFDEALPMIERALTIRQKRFGFDHRQTAISLNNLAAILGDTGKSERALELYERALSIDEKILGPDHPNTAVKISNIACLFEESGQFDAAQTLFEKSLAIKERAYGPDHERTAGGLVNLANLLRRRKQYEAALPLCERAVSIRERTSGPNHVETGTALKTYASVLSGLKRHDEALAVEAQVLAIYESTLGKDHEFYAATLNNMGLSYSALMRFEEALGCFERSIDILTRTRPSNYKSRLTMMRNYAHALKKAGREMEAEQMLWRVEHDKSVTVETSE